METLVEGQKITVNFDTLSDAFELSEKVDTQSYPSTKSAKDLFLKKYSNLNLEEPSSSRPRQLTIKIMSIEPRLLQYILVRTLINKAHSRELITDYMLEVLYLILENFEINHANYILEHMKYCATSKKDTHLPYANLLTHFFLKVGVDTEGEEMVSKGVPVVDEDALKALGMFKVELGVWKLVNEMSSEEMAFVKALTGKDVGKQPALDENPLLERLGLVEDCIEGMREDMNHLWASHESLLSGVRFNCDLIQAKLNELFTVCTLTNHASNYPSPSQNRKGLLLIVCPKSASI